ncbi:MAG: DNA repair protein RecN [Bacteroidales bacterium]|nr:DNA repair protein RecN [Bacteroidales bacterium]
MLQSLYLNNFAIIDELTVDFNDGFTVITGETGAGKSILAGSLSFICGNKTDINILKNKEKKATVEAVFTDKSDSVNDFLKKQEIEPSTEIILRRELLPSGASRCYINETNVTVTILKEISFYLIDIHSQHQNLLLTRQNFQLFVLDSIANQHTDLIIYHEKYLKFKQFQSKLSVLKDEQQKSQQQLDFLTFQLNELNALTYSVQDFYDAEQESQTLEHAENISLKLNEIIYASHESEHAILIQFKNIIKTLQSLNNQYHKSSDWAQRIESIYFDFKDLVSEIENELHRIQSNPARLEQLQNELSSIYSLLQKHRLRNYDELLSLKEELQTKLSQISNIDEEVAKYEKEIKLLESELETLAHILHTKRQAVSDKLVKNILPLLEKLGMPQAKFIIELNYTEHLMESGKTNVDFLFSANTKIPPQPIEKIASGGEISRLMLSLKTIIAKNHPCETIFFDEIDTGISGEIAYQMGLIMQQLAQLMQVITITHLPQVAACGKHHKLVSKYQNSKGTEVTVKALTDEERINEIAKMLSAKEITKSAIEQAKHLLQIK